MTISESRRKKLQMLLRSPSRANMSAARGVLRDAEMAVGGISRRKDQLPVPLTQACPGKEQTLKVGGRKLKYWLIERRGRQVAPDCVDIARQYSAIMRGARQNFDELTASPALCHAADMPPGDLLFMDTETCGLAGAMIFLVGVMFWRRGQLIFHQYLARDYAEEAAILATFAERYAGCGVLVTFNGKSFDMTMIRDRCAFHGVKLPEVECPHLDLLHESRRRWKKQLPNCRLQTLEKHLCGRYRTGDIPGSDIPQAYHDFVRTEDAVRVKAICHHNLVDLLTLAELLCALLTSCEPVVDDLDRGQRGSLGQSRDPF